MPKFRKKPVVIDAVQFRGYDKKWLQVVDDTLWLETAYEDGILSNIEKYPTAGLLIETLEGQMYAWPGDWIIRGVKGELYPCKPDIFEATYEKVDE